MDVRDAAALQRAQGGDREGFRELVEWHSASVFRVAFRLTGNEQDAEDVVQETFLRAGSQLGRFEHRSAVSTWLYRIAVNCAVDLLRRRPNAASNDIEGASESLTTTEPGPERSTFGAEIQLRMAAALALLTPLERAAFTLRHVEGCSIAEIGSVLHLRNGAARHSVFRAVAKMRRALAYFEEVLGRH
jgi:RNA polymerase sigma-70 factor (ECF subfamily)